MVFAMLVIFYQTVELFCLFGQKLISSVQHQTFMEEEKGRPLAALFFGILLFLEIMQTIRVFTEGHSIKLRIILIVGLIAAVRKLLLMDMSHADPMSEIALAALIIALSLGYFLVSRSGADSESAEHGQD
jgi:uncharacterized membrane protein (DUF373 family)